MLEFRNSISLLFRGPDFSRLSCSSSIAHCRGCDMGVFALSMPRDKIHPQAFPDLN